MPIVAPIAGIIITYSGNAVYQFLHEQEDKKFLREIQSINLPYGKPGASAKIVNIIKG